MRRLHLPIVLLAIVAAPTMAQNRPDVPAAPDARPPALEIIDDSVQPQVTIRKREGEMVEEYRVNGRLYKIKVTPENGAPYTLVDLKGDGSFVPADGPGSPTLSVPMWVIGTF